MNFWKKNYSLATQNLTRTKIKYHKKNPTRPKIIQNSRLPDIRCPETRPKSKIWPGPTLNDPKTKKKSNNVRPKTRPNPTRIRLTRTQTVTWYFFGQTYPTRPVRTRTRPDPPDYHLYSQYYNIQFMVVASKASHISIDLIKKLIQLELVCELPSHKLQINDLCDAYAQEK
jgi:hypothetical protein